MACIVEKSSDWKKRKQVESAKTEKKAVKAAEDQSDQEDLEDAIMAKNFAGEANKDIATALGVSPQKVAAVIKKNKKVD